jgi:hypothetical protein
MKSLIKLVPTYLQDSYQVLQESKDLGELPSNAKLFTAHAVSMYTNINTKHGIEIFHKWLMEYNNELPFNFPTPLFLKILEIIMTAKIFQFDDLYFHQEDSTAIGTSCVVLYASLYYGYHEKVTLIPQFSNSLHYFKCFVNDMIGTYGLGMTMNGNL